MDPDSTLPCALYLSPNGRTFKTKEEVDDFEAILEEERRVKRQKKMEKSDNLVKTSETKRESGRKIEEKKILLTLEDDNLEIETDVKTVDYKKIIEDYRAFFDNNDIGDESFEAVEKLAENMVEDKMATNKQTNKQTRRKPKTTMRF